MIEPRGSMRYFFVKSSCLQTDLNEAVLWQLQVFLTFLQRFYIIYSTNHLLLILLFYDLNASQGSVCLRSMDFVTKAVLVERVISLDSSTRNYETGCQERQGNQEIYGTSNLVVYPHLLFWNVGSNNRDSSAVDSGALYNII